jgi:large subunit ribosomal protein L24
MPAHIRKDDEVVILAGDYKGQTGRVVKMLPRLDRVVVHGSGIDGITRNLRPTRANPQGGRVQVDRSFHISNVAPVADGKPTRVRFETKPDGSKVRLAARTGAELGKVRGPRKKK